MSKRKEENSRQGDKDAKKQRVTHAAGIVADTLDSDQSLDVAIHRACFVPRIAVYTLKLVDMLKSNDSYEQRMKTLIDVFKKDADQPESMLDWTLVTEGDNVSIETSSRITCMHLTCSHLMAHSFFFVLLLLYTTMMQVCVMWQLLRFLFDCQHTTDNVDARKAQDLIYKVFIPMLPNLLRSFDPVTVDARTGDNALHRICRLLDLAYVTGWSSKLARMFIDHGVDVHARNKKGRTPLLEYAASAWSGVDSANAIRMLLAHGSDLHAQDSDGNSILHHLVERRALGMLEDLFTGDYASHLDFMMRNSVGHTVADVAVIKLLAENSRDSDSDNDDRDRDDSDTGDSDIDDIDNDINVDDEDSARARGHIHRLVLAQVALWTKYTQPVLLRCLGQVLHVTDIAKLTLSYIDGSGTPFASAEKDGPDVQNEPTTVPVATH